MNSNKPSLKQRFAAWLENVSMLDDAMEKDLAKGSDQKAQENEKAAYDAWEMRQKNRHDTAVQEEHAVYEKIHRWSMTGGAKMATWLYRLFCIGVCIAVTV
ncbi:MAG: hypothetical protein IIX10_04285, partial [Clostridia bacterium]|nr:hypothetical protein [Clostridia bacterium]